MTYSRWNKTTDDPRRLVYEWVGTTDTHAAMNVAVVGEKTIVRSPSPAHEVWELRLRVDGEVVADFHAVYGEETRAETKAAGFPVPEGRAPAPNKQGARSLLSWWCRTNPRPLGTLARWRGAGLVADVELPTDHDEPTPMDADAEPDAETEPEAEVKS